MMDVQRRSLLNASVVMTSSYVDNDRAANQANTGSASSARLFTLIGRSRRDVKGVYSVVSRRHRRHWLVRGVRQGRNLVRDIAINVVGNLIAASIVWLLLSATGYVRSYPRITYWTGILLAFTITIGITVILNGLLVDSFGDDYNAISETGERPNLPKHLQGTYGLAEFLEVLFWFISALGVVLVIINALPWIDLAPRVISIATAIYLLSAFASSVSDLIVIGRLGGPESDSATE